MNSTGVDRRLLQRRARRGPHLERRPQRRPDRGRPRPRSSPSAPGSSPATASTRAPAPPSPTRSRARPTGTAVNGPLWVAGFPLPRRRSPPAAPTGLAATPGNGLVTLAWTANTEPDLAGYRVFRSDDACRSTRPATASAARRSSAAPPTPTTTARQRHRVPLRRRRGRRLGQPLGRLGPGHGHPVGRGRRRARLRRHQRLRHLRQRRGPQRHRLHGRDLVPARRRRRRRHDRHRRHRVRHPARRPRARGEAESPLNHQHELVPRHRRQRAACSSPTSRTPPTGTNHPVAGTTAGRPATSGTTPRPPTTPPPTPGTCTSTASSTGRSPSGGNFTPEIDEHPARLRSPPSLNSTGAHQPASSRASSTRSASGTSPAAAPRSPRPGTTSSRRHRAHRPLRPRRGHRHHHRELGRGRPHGHPHQRPGLGRRRSGRPGPGQRGPGVQHRPRSTRPTPRATPSSASTPTPPTPTSTPSPTPPPGCPDGVSIDPATGVISGHPVAHQRRRPQRRPSTVTDGDLDRHRHLHLDRHRDPPRSPSAGTVTAGGTGVDGAIVCVFDALDRRPTSATPPRPTGTYSFTLAPGTYKLCDPDQRAGLPRPGLRARRRPAPTPPSSTSPRTSQVADVDPRRAAAPLTHRAP